MIDKFNQSNSIKDIIYIQLTLVVAWIIAWIIVSAIIFGVMVLING
jgi:hypothetical protein